MRKRTKQESNSSLIQPALHTVETRAPWCRRCLGCSRAWRMDESSQLAVGCRALHDQWTATRHARCDQRRKRFVELYRLSTQPSCPVIRRLALESRSCGGLRSPKLRKECSQTARCFLEVNSWISHHRAVVLITWSHCMAVHRSTNIQALLAVVPSFQSTFRKVIGPVNPVRDTISCGLICNYHSITSLPLYSQQLKPFISWIGFLQFYNLNQTRAMFSFPEMFVFAGRERNVDFRESKNQLSFGFLITKKNFLLNNFNDTHSHR